MSDTTNLKAKRKLSTFELSRAAKAALNRITQSRGWTKTRAVELALLEMSARLESADKQLFNAR